MSIRVDSNKIKEYVTKIFIAAGLKQEDAAAVADNLVAAELRGVRSHGLVQVRNYVERYKEGSFHKAADIKVIRETDTTAVIDADLGPGAVVGKYAMNKAIEKAKKSGIAVTTVRNATHFGMAAYYALEAVKENMIGFAFTNAGLIVAPYAGKKKELGTNPICIAVPAKEHLPVVFDAATSEAAYNKIFFARVEQRSIPQGWAIDGAGQPTTDPAVAIDEGALVPFGGYKGYGLAFVVNILTGILSGASAEYEDGKLKEDPYAVGYNFAALDISKFTDVEEFKALVDLFVDRVKGSSRVEENVPIYVPGELEDLRREDALSNGLEIYDGVAGDLRYTGEKLGIDLSLEDCVISD